MISEQIQNMVLAWPKEQKLSALKELQAQGEFNMLVELSNVFLTAPISQGGLPSQIIEQTLEP